MKRLQEIRNAQRLEVMRQSIQQGMRAVAQRDEAERRRALGFLLLDRPALKVAVTA